MAEWEEVFLCVFLCKFFFSFKNRFFHLYQLSYIFRNISADLEMKLGKRVDEQNQS